MEESAGPEPYQRNHPALREHQKRGRVGQQDNEGKATRSKREIKERTERRKRKMIKVSRCKGIFKERVTEKERQKEKRGKLLVRNSLG